MRAPTDLPKRRRRSKSGRIVIVVVAAALVLLLLSLRGIAGFYTDYLWFGELRLTSVWRSILGTKIGLAVVFTLAFFVIMWVNLKIADLIAPPFRPMGPEEQVIERYHSFIGSRAGLVRIGLSAVFALVAGPGAAGQWNSWLLFRNSVSFGTKDPQFGRDVGFFVFRLPFISFTLDWLFATILIVLLVTAVAHYLNGGIRFQTPMQKVTPQVKVHLSVLLAILALLKAAGYYFQRFELVYSERGVVQGATYTDVKAQLPAINLLLIISLFACALFLVNILRRGWVLPVIAVGLWALVSVAAGAAYPAFVQKFRVQPNESTKERPYIARNIEATRRAFNLSGTNVRDFQYNTQLSATDLANNEETVRNIRLWDPAVLIRTYKRLQEIRTFYQFNDVDVDRYQLGDRTTQVEISARELNPGGIPSPSWVNQHLVYTHGYAAVASPSNAVAADGNPDFLMKDLPPQSPPGGIEITQPAIYFGQNVGSYAIVDTKQKEIDFTEANGTNHTSTYRGTGGVKMGSRLRRAALALRFGNVDTLISSFIGPNSKAIYVRDIDERVRKAAPFLRYDSDPYPVVFKGKIYWIYDAYTVSGRYPYSQQADTSRLRPGSGLSGNINYVRNSVKVVIDAYNGSMVYYVVDDNDPIAKAYAKAFPKLFTDASEMDPELRQHLRYPEDLFRVQTNMYGLYHMTDAASFYNKTDAWDIAQAPGAVGSAVSVATAQSPAVAQQTQAKEPRMVPYYLLMRLPEEQQEDFLLLQPFVPFSKDDSRKDLTAFMVAKGDPDNYGQLEAFVMPRQLQIDGPALVNARINQQPEISKEITLLGSPGQGSKVILGNMLLIPVEQSILYVQPLYVESDQTPLPQLKRVIAVYSDKVVMRETLAGALTAIFGEAPPTLEQEPREGQPEPTTTPTPTPEPGATPPANPTVQDLINQATSHFDSAQAALGRGDLAGYQRENDIARDLIRQASQAIQGTAAAAPPAPPAPAEQGTA